MKKGCLLFLAVFIALLSVATAYGACEKTVVFLEDSLLLKEIPSDVPPVPSTENISCYVKKGSNACIIEEKSYPSTLLYLKLEILNGDCVGKIGWAHAERVKQQ